MKKSEWTADSSSGHHLLAKILGGGRGPPCNHDSKKRRDENKKFVTMFTSFVFLLVIASTLGAEVGSDEWKLSPPISSKDDLSSLVIKAVAVGEMVGDWTSAFACTVNTDGSPSLVDEASCASDAQDANGKSCVWCDASSVIGTGICLSDDVKEMAGQYWDQVCASSSSVGPPPTPPTPPPTTPPAPVPAPDDEFQCSLDSNKNVIKDEVECSAQKDATGASCEWCNVAIIGGACVTASMKTEFGSICSSSEKTRREGRVGNLRSATTVDDGHDGGGGLGGGIGDWKQLDPSCLGDSDGGLVNDGDACVGRTDKEGKSCVWCDAGAFGICASSDQRDIIGGYMNCDSDSDVVVVAVE